MKMSKKNIAVIFLAGIILIAVSVIITFTKRKEKNMKTYSFASENDEIFFRQIMGNPDKPIVFDEVIKFDNYCYFIFRNAYYTDSSTWISADTIKLNSEYLPIPPDIEGNEYVTNLFSEKDKLRLEFIISISNKQEEHKQLQLEYKDLIKAFSTFERIPEDDIVAVLVSYLSEHGADADRRWALITEYLQNKKIDISTLTVEDIIKYESNV